MTGVRVGAVVALALAAGLWLRLARLDARPMHHDEANQAVLAAQRVDQLVQPRAVAPGGIGQLIAYAHAYEPIPARNRGAKLMINEAVTPHISSSGQEISKY